MKNNTKREYLPIHNLGSKEDIDFLRMFAGQNQNNKSSKYMFYF